MLGTNQVLGWRVNNDPAAIADMQRMHIDLVNLSPAGGFFVAFQVAFYGGMVLAAPFMLYFIASFVFPALRIKERKYIYRALFIGGGLFLMGVSFCYFVLMPVALAASQMYSQWLGLGAMQWRAEEYISFVCKFMLGMGLGFELPVVILTLVKIGVLSYRTLPQNVALHDRHQPGFGRGADHAGSRHAGADGRAALHALRNHRLDRVVLGAAGPGQSAPRAVAGGADLAAGRGPGVGRLGKYDWPLVLPAFH